MYHPHKQAQNHRFMFPHQLMMIIPIVDCCASSQSQCVFDSVNAISVDALGSVVKLVHIMVPQPLHIFIAAAAGIYIL